MRQVLKLHPESRCTAVTGIEVEVTRQRLGLVELRYRVTGAIGDVILPPWNAPTRADGLWRRTCFEAFVRAPAGEAYCEFNFASSGQWAAYQFDAYREGMQPLKVATPVIAVTRRDEDFELTATFELGGRASRLGLSAVIEEADGTLSYWALAHPSGKPDFHHADCFAGQVPAIGRP